MSAFALLSACSGGAGGGAGGGGTGSTPTPTPAPAPTPTPTPTPTATNVSLLDPKVSESFTNDAVLGTASYPTSGAAGTSTAAASTISVNYDAGSNSYTILAPGRSQTFRPSDRDAAQSSTATSVFVRTNGSTTDSLTITNPSATAGVLAYKYVGAGFWQRTVQTSSTISGSFDAFTFGVKTPDAATPRTGAANFNVDLIGITSQASNVYGVSGRGTLQADFLNGQVRIEGTANEIDASTGFVTNPYMAFYSLVPMSSSANSFGGAFRYYMTGSPTPPAYDGSIAGRFYGPAAEEVGGAFWARRADGASVVGTITGARGSTGSGTNLSLTNLFADQRFYAPNTAEYDPFGKLFYTAATQSWSYQPINLASDSRPSFGPGDRNAALSNARFTVYDKTTSIGTFRYMMYNPGAGNDQLALSYSSFGTWDGTWVAFPGAPTASESHLFAFGIKTPNANIPTTGSATYTGIIYGRASDSSNPHSYTVGGTSRFEFNFGGNTFSVLLHPTGIEKTLGTAVDFGNFTFTGRNLGDLFGVDSGNNPHFYGYLTGPNAEEIVGTFNTSAQDPLDPTRGIGIYGATVGKRCSGPC